MRTRRVRIRPSQAISAPKKELPWDVITSKVYCNNTVAQDYKAIQRNDSKEILSIVKNRYQPIHNSELIDITHKLSEFTGFSIEGYTEAQGGRKVMAYLKNNESHNIAGFETNNYMMLGNSFDKTTGFFIGEVDEMLRCMNQWSKIMMKQNVRHKGNAKSEIDKIVRLYQNFIERQNQSKRKYEEWHGIQIPEELRELFVDKVLEVDPLVAISTRKANQRIGLFESVNREMAEMGDTAFALFNGATHYSTHTSTSVNKVFGNVFGAPATINKRAELIIEDMILEYQLN